MSRPAPPFPREDPVPRQGPLGPGKTYNMSISLYPGDQEILEWLVSKLGSSRSDAVRTSIRAMAMHLQAIEKTLERKGK